MQVQKFIDISLNGSDSSVVVFYSSVSELSVVSPAPGPPGVPRTSTEYSCFRFF